MAELVTLSGHLDFTQGGGVYAPYIGEDEFLCRPRLSRSARRARICKGRADTDELMGGLLDYFVSAGKAVASPFTSIAKGTGHFVAEAGRGISRGDIGRLVASPFKGIGHAGGSFYRTGEEHLEWYWRPSKMEQWMTPVGATMMSIAPITGPAAPFLLGGGALLTAGGATAGVIRDKERAGKAQTAYEITEAQNKKKRNMLYIALAVAGGAVALVAMT